MYQHSQSCQIRLKWDVCIFDWSLDVNKHKVNRLIKDVCLYACENYYLKVLVIFYPLVGVHEHFASGARSAVRRKALIYILGIRRRSLFGSALKRELDKWDLPSSESWVLPWKQMQSPVVCAVSYKDRSHLKTLSIHLLHNLLYLCVDEVLMRRLMRCVPNLSLSFSSLHLACQKAGDRLSHVECACGLCLALISGRWILPIIITSEKTDGIYSVRCVRQPPVVNSVTSPAGWKSMRHPVRSHRALWW